MTVGSSIFFIAGWAQQKTSLKPLAHALGAETSGKLLSVHSLEESEAQSSEKHFASKPSAYARGLYQQLSEAGNASILVGWSMGGMVALEAAIHFPDFVKQLVLISSTACFCKAPYSPFGVEEEILSQMIEGLRRQPQTVFKQFFALAYSRDEFGVCGERKVSEAMSFPIDELVSGLEYLRSCDLTERLRDIKCPTLVLHSRDDKIISWEAGDLLGREINTASLELFDSESHGLVETEPKRMVGEIASFLVKDEIQYGT